jgi:mRNA interferase MazF
MPVNRGDIVLVAVPFTSGGGTKTRPVLVVQSDHNNRRLQDTIVAVITSTTQRAHREATQLLIEVATTDGQQSGLLHDSAVKCERLHTVLQSQIQRTVGSLSAALLQQIDVCLKVALALP